jgi:hypothetical protein
VRGGGSAVDALGGVEGVALGRTPERGVAVGATGKLTGEFAAFDVGSTADSDGDGVGGAEGKGVAEGIGAGASEVALEEAVGEALGVELTPGMGE